MWVDSEGRFDGRRKARRPTHSGSPLWTRPFSSDPPFAGCHCKSCAARLLNGWSLSACVCQQCWSGQDQSCSAATPKGLERQLNHPMRTPWSEEAAIQRPGWPEQLNQRQHMQVGCSLLQQCANAGADAGAGMPSKGVQNVTAAYKFYSKCYDS